MDLGLKGKVAVVTGGTEGIGRASALTFAREGAHVAICARREGPLEETAAEIRREGGDVLALAADMSKAADIERFMKAVADRFGRIDILVNNAAFQRTYGSLEDIPDEEWSYTFRTNIEAMFHLVKAAVPHMAPGSSIIGSSSVNSDMPSPTLAPYAATKAAIANFCASLAQMLGEKGIRVNSVAPGPIWTPLIPATMPTKKVKSFGADTPLGRAGQPAELAPVYVLLASDDGSYISGARIAVTGGRPIL